MKQFVPNSEQLYDVIVNQSKVAGSKIVVVAGFTHTTNIHRFALIERIPHGEVAMKGINQLILKNGTRIYINSAGDTSLMGMRPELVAIFECMHLNMVNVPSFIGNSLKVACDVVVTDEKPNERVKTLQVFEFEGI